jgi:hypothetical protein
MSLPSFIRAMTRGPQVPFNMGRSSEVSSCSDCSDDQWNASLQRVHRRISTEPCSWSVTLIPAARSRLSTFCVSTEDTNPISCIYFNTWCIGVGDAACTSSESLATERHRCGLFASSTHDWIEYKSSPREIPPLVVSLISENIPLEDLKSCSPSSALWTTGANAEDKPEYQLT